MCTIHPKAAGQAAFKVDGSPLECGKAAHAAGIRGGLPPAVVATLAADAARGAGGTADEIDTATADAMSAAAGTADQQAAVEAANDVSRDSSARSPLYNMWQTSRDDVPRSRTYY